MNLDQLDEDSPREDTASSVMGVKGILKNAKNNFNEHVLTYE
jgi:hypothetical protein